MRKKKDKKNTWDVFVRTSDVKNAGTDANVGICLYGKKGKSEEIILDNKGDNFEKGQMDHFKVNIEEVGTLYKLRVYHDNSGQAAGWHLEKIEMENLGTGDKYSFPCNRWLADDEDDRSIVREIPAKGPSIKNPLPLDKYIVQVYTGSRSMAGTDANVYINVFGQRGDTGVRALRKSQNMNKFEKGKMDEFEIEAVSVLKLTKIGIGHDEKGIGAGWFLDKVVVKQVGEKKYDQEFVCQRYFFPGQRWLWTKADDGQISPELVPVDASLKCKLSRQDSKAIRNEIALETIKGIIETGESNNNATGFGSSQQRQPMENAQERPNNNTGEIVSGLQTMQGVQENYGSVNKGQLRALGIQPAADERQTGSLTERKKLKAYIPPKNTCIFDGRLIKLEQADIDDLCKNNTIPIGQGSFGKVFKSENPSEGFGMHVVVKKIPLIGEEQNRSIIREMMASRIMHPFILPLLAVVDRPEGKPEVWFVSPRGNKGDLHGVIQYNSEDLNMEKRIKILLHIALAIQYIHTEVSKVREAVLHKDIASRNIVLDDNYNARLIDFGLARETSDTTSKASGRDFYAHPEIGKGFHAKEAWDYFAFGVIMRELLTSLGPDGVSNRYLKYMTEDEIRNYAYVKIWKPNPSEEVEKFVRISSSLLQQNNWTVSDFKENVVEELQDIWTYFGETEILQLSNYRCHVCMINPIAQETSMKQQHSCNCTQHIKACIACEKNSFLNPLTCYCGTELTPVIGSRWGALLVAGTDTENKGNTEVMARDIKEIEKLITSKAPRIIGISKEDIRTLVPDVPNNANMKGKTCREMDEENLGDNGESNKQPNGENLWPKVKAHIEYFRKRTDLDTLFIYFSCHGGKTENSFHLGSETDRVSLLDFQNELAKLENIEKLVLVLDQCFPPKVQFCNSERKFIQISACETYERASMTNISTFTKWFITGLKARAEKSACPDNCRPCREFWQMTTDFITYSNLHKYLSDHLKEANEKCPQIYNNGIDINSNFAFHTDEEVLIDFTDGKNDLRLTIGYLQDITNLKEQLVKAFGKKVEVDNVLIEKQTYRKDKEFEKCDTLEKVMQAWVLRQKLRVKFKTE